MSLRDLVFDIFARDRTARAFGAVDRKLNGIGASIERAQAKFGNFGRKSAKIGGYVTAAMAPVALAFRDSLALYDTQARAMAKVEQAVKSTGGAAGYTAKDLYGMAGALQDVTRYGDEAILDGVTAQLLTFDKIGGDVFARAQEAALDLSTVLNKDLQSSSIMLGKALNDPVKGLNAMSRAGVSFTEDQEAVIKALVKTGDIAGAQMAILDVLATQYGGQARAAALAGIGPLEQLKNAWGDVKEEVGRVLSEILPPIVGFFQKLVKKFQALPEPMRNFIVVIGLVAVALGPLIVSVGLLAIAVNAVSWPVLAVVAVLALLGTAIYVLWEPIKGIAGFVAGVFVAAWQGLVRVLGVVADFVSSQFMAAWDGLKQAFANVLDDPLEFAKALGNLLLSINPVAVAIKGLVAVFEWLFPGAMEPIRNLVSGIKEWLLDKLTGIFDGVKDKIFAVGDAFYDLWDRVVGHSYVPDMVDGIGAEMARLNAEMVDPAKNATHKVGGSFADLKNDVLRDLGDLADNGDLTMRSFFDTMLSAGSRWRDQMMSQVFDQLADQASQKLSSLGGGFGGNFGSGGGRAGFVDALASFGASLFGGGDALAGALNGAGLNATAPAMNTGGEAALIGGRGGIDRNLVRLRLSEGERVQVTKRGQVASGANVTVNIQTPNPAAFQASRAQVAGTVSRAVAYGQRGM